MTAHLLERRGQVLRAIKAYAIVLGIGVMIAVYQDHSTLTKDLQRETAKAGRLAEDSRTLAEALEKKRHSLSTTDPAYHNMLEMFGVFMAYRRSIGYTTRPCYFLFSAPPGSSTDIANVITPIAVRGSNCHNGNLQNLGVKPYDIEAEEKNGMLPGIVLVHAMPEEKGVDQLVDNLGNFIQTRRSYTLPRVAPQNTIWLQFGPDVKWNTQIR